MIDTVAGKRILTVEDAHLVPDGLAAAGVSYIFVTCCDGRMPAGAVG